MPKVECYMVFQNRILKTKIMLKSIGVWGFLKNKHVTGCSHCSYLFPPLSCLKPPENFKTNYILYLKKCEVSHTHTCSKSLRTSSTVLTLYSVRFSTYTPSFESSLTYKMKRSLCWKKKSNFNAYHEWFNLYSLEDLWMKALGDLWSSHCISPKRNTCSYILIFHPSCSPPPTNNCVIICCYRI